MSKGVAMMIRGRREDRNVLEGWEEEEEDRWKSKEDRGRQRAGGEREA